MDGWRWPLILLLLGICGVLYLRLVWYEWYPKLKATLDSILVRFVFVVLSFLAGVYGHIQARNYLNTLTGVDPSNFPTTLLTFTSVAILGAWLMFIGVCSALCGLRYMVITGLKRPLQTQERTVPLGCWFKNNLAEIGRDAVRLFGPFAVFLVCLLPGIMLQPPYEPRMRSLAKLILVHSEFSYDKTCSASSDTHWVAPLKDRKERDFPKVIIVDLTSPDIQFSFGACK